MWVGLSIGLKAVFCGLQYFLKVKKILFLTFAKKSFLKMYKTNEKCIRSWRTKIKLINLF